MAKIGLFYGTQTGNTEEIATQIHTLLGGDAVARLHDVADCEASDLLDYNCLIIGCPTWNTGELQSDWDGLYGELDDLDFSHKQVAYFGLGDQVGYGDNFLDAIGILEAKIAKLGGQTVGQWPAAGYEFDASMALRGSQLVGLGIDEDNQSDLTEERLQSWVNQLKRQWSV
ncbi:flavodoxin FldA [Spirulina major]|uniref:flavodoxin FldA n=1 Tax=Spirulina major TaxID=270636 RepID=UPI00093459E0|nr:flavodoxin FldA [Spirulina major]